MAPTDDALNKRDDALLAKMKEHIDGAVKGFNDIFTTVFAGLGTKVLGNTEDIARVNKQGYIY